MKKFILPAISILLSVLIFNSCSKKDLKTEPQPEEVKPGKQPEETSDITFVTYKLEDQKGVIELVSDTTNSKVYFYGNFDGKKEENLLVNAITYQSPGGDSLYHFILDAQHRVERMYITFPDGSFDTTLLTFSYPHPDTTVVRSYYFNWKTYENRLHFSAKTYYKNDKLVALPNGRFSLGEFKKESLKTIIGSVAAAVGVVEVTGAVIALAATAPAWAIVGAGVAIVAFTNSAMASDEMVLSETTFQGPISPAAHFIPQLPDPSGDDQDKSETLFKDAAVIREILSANGIAVSDPRWDSEDPGVIKSLLEEYGCAISEQSPLKYSRVIKLQLEEKGLTTLPESIGELTEVYSISLRGNKLAKLPAAIFNLANLYELSLQANQLTTIPEEIGNLTNLYSLILHGNQLTSVPASIGNLKNLTYLYLSVNQLTSIPSSIGDLAKLTLLELRVNQLTSIPPSIGNLENLKGLSLDVNQLTAIPFSVGSLINLTNLSLSSNRLAALPSSIGNLVNLTILGLSNNQLTAIPKEIGNLTQLTQLSLYNNRLTTIPQGIGNLTQLTQLPLYENQLVALPEEIGNLTNLTVLNLRNNQLTALPPSIGRLVNLTELNLNSNQFAMIPAFIGNLTHLTTLKLYGNHLRCLPQSVWNLGSSVVDWQGNAYIIDGETYGLCTFGDTNCDDIPCSEQ